MKNHLNLDSVFNNIICLSSIVLTKCFNNCKLPAAFSYKIKISKLYELNKFNFFMFALKKEHAMSIFHKSESANYNILIFYPYFY